MGFNSGFKGLIEMLELSFKETGKIQHHILTVFTIHF